MANMMKLSFRIDDILRDESQKIQYQTYSKTGAKKTSTSDGESTRSESPDSTMSTGSDDYGENKGNRRGRTVILNWQKRGLENAFAHEKYPTVPFLEKLSDQLSLSHYVTKVWFQNRRSKLRKEGNRAEPRTQETITDTYPVKKYTDEALKIRDMPVLNQVIEEVDQTMRIQDVEPRQVMSQQVFQDRQLCSCPDCVRRPNESRPDGMPVLIRESTSECQPLPTRQQLNKCNCRTCYLKSENEVRMRLLSSKPRFDNYYAFSPEVVSMTEKRKGISRDNAAIPNYNAVPVQQRILADSSRVPCDCSQCRYALKTSYYTY